MKKLLLALVATTLAAAAHADDGFVLVVHPSNKAASVSRQEAAALFMKRTTTWPGGTPVAPVDLADGPPAREAFCKAVHAKPSAALRAYWARVQFAGRDLPPPTRGSDEEVLAFVRATPGAIGYVSPSAPLAGVRALPVR